MAKKLIDKQFVDTCHRQGLLIKGNTKDWDQEELKQQKGEFFDQQANWKDTIKEEEDKMKGVETSQDTQQQKIKVEDEDEIKELLQEMEEGERKSKLKASYVSPKNLQNSQLKNIPLSNSHYVQINQNPLDQNEQKQEHKLPSRSKRDEMNKMDDFIKIEDPEQQKNKQKNIEKQTEEQNENYDKKSESDYSQLTNQIPIQEQQIIGDMRIHSLQKIEEYSGVCEDDTLRPHQACQIMTKKIIFEYKQDVFLDIEKQLRYTMFLWDDLIGFNDMYLMGELARFQDETYYVLEDLLLELKKYKVVPLKWIPKKLNIKKKKLKKKRKEQEEYIF